MSRGSANGTIDWYEKLKRSGFIDSMVFVKREQTCQEIRAMLSKMISTWEKE
ncbi:MAG: four helix bundle protein [Candidatus Kuenenia stuttgartiensis]|nr:four helix bundle protein [Candidatus Kuenenia stuttgartiensis]MCF6151434.1 four helix bundle protein [Candidatus Kuenenia stuttgartiensis]